MQTPRSLPHSDDAEKALLCSLCLSPDLVGELPHLAQGFWYWPAHRIIFSAIAAILSNNDPLDFISLKTRLLAQRQLEEVGGHEYLQELWTFVPSAANWRSHFRILCDRYVRRSMIAEFSKFVDLLYDETADLGESAAERGEKFFTSMALRAAEPPRLFRDQIDDTLQWLDDQSGERGVGGIRFGLAGLDGALYGLRFSELCGIGARPSDGKSALLVNLARTAVQEQGIPTAIFSLEMPYVQQIVRMFALESDVALTDIRRGRMRGEDGKRVVEAAGRMREWPMHLMDSVNLSFESFCSRCRQLRVRHGVRLFGLDMIGLLNAPRAERFDLSLALVVQGCKNLALELDSVVVVLTQLNEQMQAKHSRAIFEACDVFLRIGKADEGGDNGTLPERKEILVEKNRMGRRGMVVPVYFDGAHMRFTDRAVGEMPDYAEPLRSLPYRD